MTRGAEHTRGAIVAEERALLRSIREAQQNLSALRGGAARLAEQGWTADQINGAKLAEGFARQPGGKP